MKNDNLVWLVQWYYTLCNGNWTDEHKIVIATLDNPGWSIKISFENTRFQNISFQKIRIDRSEHNWVRCYIEDGKFKGFGGPFNLLEILQIFRNWVESL